MGKKKIIMKEKILKRLKVGKKNTKKIKLKVMRI
jgi:hypothetical protein